MTLLFLLLIIFTLITLWAGYSIRSYYGVLKEEKISIKDRIVTEEDKKNIYNNLSLAFYLAAIAVFFLQYIAYIEEKGSFKIAIIKALSLVGIGISIRVIQAIKKESLKESLTIVALVSSIPIVLLQSLKFGSVTVWTFPMIIIISSVIFSKKTLLVSATLVSIMTQILIWILHPEVTVIVDKYDYILRIAIFIATFLIGLFINKIYLSKIKENNQQIRLQKLNLEITSDFADINEENFDEKINIILSKIGLFLGVDRTCLHLINNENNTMIRSHQWCKEEENMEAVPNKDTCVSVSPWLKSQLQGNKIIYIEDVSKIAHEARWERELLMVEKVKSLVAAPIEDKGVLQGIIGIDSMSYFENWSEQKIEFINIVSKLLSSGINKIESEKEINFMAYYDPLTKLPNRFLLEDRVNRAIDLEEKYGGIISVISIDIDNFKVVNDTMGQTSGDYVLKKLAKDLNNLVGKNGSVSRSSGDEFVIMLNNMKDENEILNLADKLLELFSKPFDVDGWAFSITISAGVAIYPRDGEDYEELVKNADIAMYQAKEMGKNQYVLCTESMKEKVQRNMILSNDMFEALERNEFIIHYQPQVNLATGEINGLEALLRWNHPERGMISPGIFIPLAEENGMINSIGSWVLKTACQQNKKWQEMGLGNLPIGVNLSAVQFVDANIAENIKKIIKETALDPKYLELEITESIAIKKETHAEKVIKKLKDTGISIAIDDFGTEYSSLSRLKKLPIDRIKIDMQFTQGIENNKKDREIIIVIINLAKGLGMNVIAEGAETKEQVDFLNREACDDVQGYYYYKPMPADEIEDILIDIRKNKTFKEDEELGFKCKNCAHTNKTKTIKGYV